MNQTATDFVKKAFEQLDAQLKQFGSCSLYNDEGAGHVDVMPLVAELEEMSSDDATEVFRLLVAREDGMGKEMAESIMENLDEELDWFCDAYDIIDGLPTAND